MAQDATPFRDHEKVAQELLAAGEQHSVIPLLTARYPEMTVADAYSIQRDWAQRRVAAGHRIVGHKIGLTSRVMQRASGISEPDYGVIFDDQVLETGAAVNVNEYSNLRVEAELAFVLGRALGGPNCSIFDVLRATDYVLPALELLNSHIELAGRTIVDTISDNAALGAMVLGGRPVRPDEVDLRSVTALVYRNQILEETGVSAGVLDHPATGVAWLVRRLSAHDESLHAGEIILSGSFTRPVSVEAGDTIHANFGSLGNVAVGAL